MFARFRTVVVLTAVLVTATAGLPAAWARRRAAEPAPAAAGGGNMQQQRIIALKKIQKTVIFRGDITDAAVDALNPAHHLTVWIDREEGFPPKSLVDRAGRFENARYLVSWPVEWTAAHVRRLEAIGDFTLVFDLRKPDALSEQLLLNQSRMFPTATKLLRVSFNTLNKPKIAESIAGFRSYLLEIDVTDMITPAALKVFSARQLASAPKNFVFLRMPTAAEAALLRKLKNVRVTLDLSLLDGEMLTQTLSSLAVVADLPKALVLKGPFFDEVAGLVSRVPKLTELRIVAGDLTPAFTQLLNR